MILRFWKTEWNVPVLPKIYSGNTWAQRGLLQPGQQEKQQWVLVLAVLGKLRADSDNYLPCCQSQRPRLAFVNAFHQCSEGQTPSYGSSQREQAWMWGDWQQKNFSRHLLWARGELICDCYCRLGGVVCLAAAVSICLHGWMGKAKENSSRPQPPASHGPVNDSCLMNR